MPYIKQEYRDSLRAGEVPGNAGELNYKISHLINLYCIENGLRYQTMNDVVGALEGAKAEFQRRVVAPYEDLKILENGDVYHENLLSRTHVRNSSI